MSGQVKIFWLYYLLVEQKEKGVVYDFKTVTEKQLIELSWFQDIVDSVIGELYDVSKEAVYRKRARLHLQLGNRPLFYQIQYPSNDWNRITLIFPELKDMDNPFLKR